MENKEEKFTKLLEILSNEDDYQIVRRFNANVQNKYFNRFLSFYLSAIHAEFDKRGIDYHQIGDSNCLSYKRKVKLVSNVLIPIHKN